MAGCSKSAYGTGETDQVADDALNAAVDADSASTDDLVEVLGNFGEVLEATGDNFSGASVLLEVKADAVFDGAMGQDIDGVATACYRLSVHEYIEDSSVRRADCPEPDGSR